jgi:uncharacterized Zn finger protein
MLESQDVVCTIEVMMLLHNRLKTPSSRKFEHIHDHANQIPHSIEMGSSLFRLKEMKKTDDSKWKSKPGESLKLTYAIETKTETGMEERELHIFCKGICKDFY